MTSAAVVLYRGFDTKLTEGRTPNPYLVAPRMPKHSNVRIHEFADQWFRQKFGIAARSACVICSTDACQAADFANPTGCLAAVHPVGESRFIYSSNVKDFLQYAAEGVTADQQSVWNWLNGQSYECVASASQISINHKGEVMVFCEAFDLQYVHLPPNTDA